MPPARRGSRRVGRGVEDTGHSEVGRRGGTSGAAARSAGRSSATSRPGLRCRSPVRSPTSCSAHRRTSPGSSPVARPVVALIAVLGVVAGPANPAFAHAELLSSDPGPGAVLDTSPTAITLTFTEAGRDRPRRRCGCSTATASRSSGGRPPPRPVRTRSSRCPCRFSPRARTSCRGRSCRPTPTRASGAFTFQIGATSTLAPDVLEQVARSARDQRHRRLPRRGHPGRW